MSSALRLNWTLPDGPAVHDMKQIGRYTVVRQLAAGDQAKVYACVADEAEVAVKVFRPQEALLARFSAEGVGSVLDRLRERFQDEAALMARFEHPNIAPILEVGTFAPDTPFYVMPLFSMSLAAEVWGRTSARHDPAAPVLPSAPKPLLVDVALRRLRDILSGLAVVHKGGVVHRDLKPRNILIASDGRAVLSDFGVAKVPWPGYTPLRPEFGTPPFVSPEQIASAADVDARSDVYSVGAIAYFILTGQFPHEGTPPDRINPQVSAPLSHWITRSLALDRDARLPNAAALLAAFDEVSPMAKRPG